MKIRVTCLWPIDFGGDSGGATPVPIPNTEVKPTSADGTWDECPRESRSPPDFRLAAGRKTRCFIFSFSIPFTLMPSRLVQL